MDTTYGIGGWPTAQMECLVGTRDAHNDTGSTPDIWSMAADWTNWKDTRTFTANPYRQGMATTTQRSWPYLVYTIRH
ncbi:hypothetical protein [Streptomyces sp. NPDC058671]|uniref:hypothetical protein n=1 Tax=Streptomyces sp. NPDC058671 TaxID=3346590 RepID=UPI003655A23D